MYVAPDSIRTGPLRLYPPSTDVLSNVAPPVLSITPGPGSVTVPLTSAIEQVVTLTVRVAGPAGGAAGAGGLLDHYKSLRLRGSTAGTSTVVIAGVVRAGVVGRDVARAADRAPRVRRSGYQTVHETRDVLELVTNRPRHGVTKLATIII